MGIWNVLSLGVTMAQPPTRMCGGLIQIKTVFFELHFVVENDCSGQSKAKRYIIIISMEQLRRREFGSKSDTQIMLFARVKRDVHFVLLS